MNLPEISVKRPVAISMVALILMVLGAVAYERLGLDFHPQAVSDLHFGIKALSLFQRNLVEPAPRTFHHGPKME